MSTIYTNTEKLRRAKKHVKRLRKFYRHLRVYLVVNAILLILKLKLLLFFTAQSGAAYNELENWLAWNTVATPLLWGIGLGIHAWLVFKKRNLTWEAIKPEALRQWETKKAAKFMQEEND